MSNFYDDLEAFTERISTTVEMLGRGKQAEAARKVGVTSATIKRWITGQADPSRTNLVRLS